MPETTIPKEPHLAVIQLESKFYRPPGDNGNIDTWVGIPTRIKILKGITPKNTVQKEYTKEYIQNWYDIIDEVIDDGAIAIVTGCGFLAAIHPLLQEYSRVPIGSSSLLQVPTATTYLKKGKKIGVVTFNAEMLTKKHLEGAGAPLDTPIVGVQEGCSFQQMIYEDSEFDFDAHCDDLLEAVGRMLKEHEDVGGIVLECTNMPPYKKAISEKFKLPIWDISTLGRYLYEVGMVRAFER